MAVNKGLQKQVFKHYVGPLVGMSLVALGECCWKCKAPLIVQLLS